MSEHSNPNHRTINVVGFLAAHPTEVFTLAEIARHLDLSKGSAHRVMTALTETGFVSRHPRHKTYSLGMALVAVGQAALEKYPGIEYTRREMIRLATELNAGFAVSAIVNNEYFLLAREGLPQSHDGLTLVGERRYVVPPIGIGQMAWRSQSDISAYLATGPHLNEAVKQHILAAFPVIRRRGYAMAANGTAIRRLMQAAVIPLGQHTHDIPSSTFSEHPPEIPPEEFQLLDFADAGGKGVNYMAAPVFSPEGDICFEILMSGLPVNLDEGELQRYAARLVQLADTVTKETRGRKPELR